MKYNKFWDALWLFRSGIAYYSPIIAAMAGALSPWITRTDHEDFILSVIVAFVCGLLMRSLWSVFLSPGAYTLGFFLAGIVVFIRDAIESHSANISLLPIWLAFMLYIFIFTWIAMCTPSMLGAILGMLVESGMNRRKPMKRSLPG